MPVIVVASPKGGVGKSTTANILMTCLARRGASVACIDADLNRPQVQWGKAAGPQPNLTIIQDTAEDSIITTIKAAASRAQFVIVDLEGVASQAATFAISQADLVIIPCGPAFLDAREAAAALRVVAECERLSRVPVRIPAAVLLTKTSPAIQPAALRTLEAQFASHGTPVYDVRLHHRAAFEAIFSRGVPLHHLDPKTVHNLAGALEIADAFMKETIRRLDEAQAGAERAVA